jgi:hypothetical protein
MRERQPLGLRSSLSRPHALRQSARGGRRGPYARAPLAPRPASRDRARTPRAASSVRPEPTSPKTPRISPGAELEAGARAAACAPATPRAERTTSPRARLARAPGTTAPGRPSARPARRPRCPTSSRLPTVSPSRSTVNALATRSTSSRKCEMYSDRDARAREPSALTSNSRSTSRCGEARSSARRGSGPARSGARAPARSHELHARRGQRRRPRRRDRSTRPAPARGRPRARARLLRDRRSRSASARRRATRSRRPSGGAERELLVHDRDARVARASAGERGA